MQDVTIYTSRLCGFCMRAKALLESKSIPFKEISVDGKPELRQHMTQLAGSRTVPQIWVGGVHVGGCQELYALDAKGQLDGLLHNTAG
ncbi:Glutaredoxin 3 [Thalassocella blandensis]|nr:Glutaredoxin 3 [Thalassocella blandensis]